MEAGKFTGKISDYGVKERNGKTFIEVYFDITGQGTVSWKGYMTEKAMENTFKTLTTLGLKGDLTKVADGPSGGALTIGSEFNLTVQNQLDAKTSLPTKYYEVRFVNPLNKAKFDSDTTTTKAKLTDVANQWKAFMVANGVKAEETKLPF